MFERLPDEVKPTPSVTSAGVAGRGAAIRTHVMAGDVSSASGGSAVGERGPPLRCWWWLVSGNNAG